MTASRRSGAAAGANLDGHDFDPASSSVAARGGRPRRTRRRSRSPGPASSTRPTRSTGSGPTSSPALPDPAHRTALRRALAFARARHGGQCRRGSDTPYWVHLVRVAMELSQWGVRRPELLQAALLHDTVEDTTTTIDEIRVGFGEEVADLVDWLTAPDREEDLREYYERLQAERALRRPAPEAGRPGRQPAQHPGARHAHRGPLPPVGGHLPAAARSGRSCRSRRRRPRWRAWRSSRPWPTSPRWSTTAASPTPNVRATRRDTDAGLDGAQIGPHRSGDDMGTTLTHRRDRSHRGPSCHASIPTPAGPARSPAALPPPRGSRRAREDLPGARRVAGLRLRQEAPCSGGTSSTAQGAWWAT